MELLGLSVSSSHFPAYPSCAFFFPGRSHAPFVTHVLVSSSWPLSGTATITAEGWVNNCYSHHIVMRLSPTKVKQGNVATLFGTADGRRLQLLAERRGWPLFWGMAAVMNAKAIFGPDSSVVSMCNWQRVTTGCKITASTSYGSKFGERVKGPQASMY